MITKENNLRKLYRRLPISGPIPLIFKRERRFLYSKVFYARSSKFSVCVRMFLSFSSPILWFFKALNNIFLNLKKNGPLIKESNGITILMQFFYLFSLAYSKKAPPYYYYYLRLYQNHYTVGDNFLLNRHLIPIYSGLLANQTSVVSIQNKVDFSARLDTLKEYLPKNEIILTATNAEELFNLSEKMNSDLFIKPMSGSSGRDCYILKNGQDSNPYLLHSLGIQDFASSILKLKQITQNKSFIVQQRLINHQSISNITNGNLATCRINTYLTPSVEVSLLFAIFLMPTETSIVSNGSKGGIISSVDLETGKIGEAISMKTPFDSIEVHPDGMGKIPGTILPFWKKVLEICIEAHQHFLDIPFIGWDVALTTDGPKLLEGNTGWSIEAWQLTHKNTFDADKFIEILNWHLRKHFEDKK